MKSTKGNLFAGLIMVLAFALMSLSLSAQTVARAQKTRPAVNVGAAVVQQPIYSEYKGVRLGMAAEEVRAKFGEPALKGDDQDYYVVSQSESAQVVYDAAHMVKAISVDYTGGVGAPDPKTVVGGELETSPGGQYRMVRYQSLGFWVSYNRTVGPVVVVTITLQQS
jgi:outer membrane protein assembly factor BamE (lipoprotein component of BamABCDE complex)